jgi:hypothetical protein
MISSSVDAQEVSGGDCGEPQKQCVVSVDLSGGSTGTSRLSDSLPRHSSGLAAIAFRSGRGGPFAHHWAEVQTSRGRFTLGFGPALIPFIDRGQISVEDTKGNVEWRYLLHPFSLHWNFARAPGAGRQLGRVVYIPIAQADRLVEKQRARRFVLPYIPLFHDCRTYVCVLQASSQGKSRLPCYLLMKGYW